MKWEPSEDEWNRIVFRWQHGDSLRTLAQNLPVSHEALNKRLKSKGITRPPTWKADRRRALEAGLL